MQNIDKQVTLILEENGFCEFANRGFSKKIDNELRISFLINSLTGCFIRTNSINSKKQEFGIYINKKDRMLVLNFIQEIIDLGKFIHENKQPFSICFHPSLNKSKYTKNKKSIDFVDENEFDMSSNLYLLEDKNGKTCIFKRIDHQMGKEKIIYSNFR